MECVARAINISRFPWRGGGLHAEMKLMSISKRKGLRTILICRVGKNGTIRPIDPCDTCSQKAKELGIRIVTVFKEKTNEEDKTN